MLNYQRAGLGKHSISSLSARKNGSSAIFKSFGGNYLLNIPGV
jgi:hypothetical protein